MHHIGTFTSRRWGAVRVMRGTYLSADGPTAIALTTDDGDLLATLSVNMYRPECSQDSRDLPRDCFYAKTWSENEDLAAEALAAGLFRLRDELATSSSGFVEAPVWQIQQRATQEALAA